ncbi:MAG: cell division protein FtsX, partial [Mangrovicoccus sp.]
MSRASRPRDPGQPGIWAWIFGEKGAAQTVPPSGFTARLVTLAAAAMAFLAVFAFALALASTRLAATWQADFSGQATLRIAAPAEDLDQATEAALQVLRTTPGIAQAHVITQAEQRALLQPWFGDELPLDRLTLPRLIALTEAPKGYDAAGLRLRLAGEVPQAILDDHNRWRRPLAQAANRLRWLAAGALGLIAITTAAVLALAAQAALAANAQVIDVLRLAGARDLWIARAFVRRFTRRAFWGALFGASCAAGLLQFWPLATATATGLLPSLPLRIFGGLSRG